MFALVDKYSLLMTLPLAKDQGGSQEGKQALVKNAEFLFIPYINMFYNSK